MTGPALDDDGAALAARFPTSEQNPAPPAYPAGGAAGPVFARNLEGRRAAAAAYFHGLADEPDGADLSSAELEQLSDLVAAKVAAALRPQLPAETADLFRAPYFYTIPLYGAQGSMCPLDVRCSDRGLDLQLWDVSRSRILLEQHYAPPETGPSVACLTALAAVPVITYRHYLGRRRSPPPTGSGALPPLPDPGKGPRRHLEPLQARTPP